MGWGPNGLSCKQLVELVTEYLEETLSPPDKLRFEQHLDICAWCRMYLEQMRQTIRSLGKLTEESVPPEAKEELLHAFRGWKKH